MLVYLIRCIMAIFTHFWWHNSKISCRRFLAFISKPPSLPFWFGQVKMPKNRPGVPNWMCKDGQWRKNAKKSFQVWYLKIRWFCITFTTTYAIVVKTAGLCARRSLVRTRSNLFGGSKGTIGISKPPGDFRFFTLHQIANTLLSSHPNCPISWMNITKMSILSKIFLCLVKTLEKYMCQFKPHLLTLLCVFLEPKIHF